ncbi:hypothetical protein FQN49_000143 [Arthroderma sp. PD_2]|nr:hypothetical protein FQN49_000143 [Arthroderma sp. PD_2]
MAPGHSIRDVEVMATWLKSPPVKDYVDACDEQQGNHAFQKAKCKKHFAKLFYGDVKESADLRYPGAFWIGVILCRIMSAFLRKSALDLITSGSHWNWPYWLGELSSLFGMGWQLVIASNSKWSTTTTRTTILVCTFISQLMDAFSAIYLGLRETDAFLNGISSGARIVSELLATIIGCWAMVYTQQPQEVDEAEALGEWNQLPAEYKYWAESSLSNYRDELLYQRAPRRSSRQRLQALPRASPLRHQSPSER